MIILYLCPRVINNVRKIVVIRNPLVWLSRIRHRRGYGVHSPFAYDLITQVLYTPGRYYADEWLDMQFPWWARKLHLRSIAGGRLLFRLANRWQGQVMVAPDALPYELAYLRAGGKKDSLMAKMPDETVDFLYLRQPRVGDLEHLHEGSLLVVGNLRNNRDFWRRLQHDERTRVTMDLYDYGLAFFDPKLQRQDYIINW